VVFLAPWVGYLVDRYDRRALLIVSEALSAVAVGGLLFAVRLETLPLVYLAVAVIRIFDAFSMPAASAILRSRVPKSALPRAVATFEALFGAMITIGPIAGSLIFGTFGIQTLLIANLVSFIVSSAITAFLPACPGTRTMTSLRAGLSEAIRMVTHNRRLRPAALTEVGYFLCFGGITTLGVIIAERSIGPDLSGLYIGGLGFGWLICSIFVVRRLGDHARALLSAGVLGCVVVGLVLWQVVPLGPVACFVGGALAGAVNVLVVSAVTIIYSERVPADAVGRVFASRRAWINLALAVSYTGLASASTALGPGATAMLAGALMTFVGGAILAPSMLADRRRPATEALERMA
jgi:MFS family permease